MIGRVMLLRELDVTDPAIDQKFRVVESILALKGDLPPFDGWDPSVNFRPEFGENIGSRGR